jgi:hypothetical protein
MRSIDLVVQTELTRSPRVKQLSGMFDVPAQEMVRHEWKGEIPIDERDWNIGLIVGPSGAGKSSVARQLFGDQPVMSWSAPSVVDDFDKKFGIQAIAEACSAVGFNTIPSWMKPYNVLSTGEKFRVELARLLLEGGDLVVVDEFTSVVDRQVAHIGSHALQKNVRKRGTKFVAVSCHYDIIEWLQPDWMLEPATMDFQWRLLRRRPALNVEIARVDHSAWKLFAPFHYLTMDLHRGAACYVLFVDGVPAAFQGILHRPHATAKNIKGSSRGVTLPDYQGLGLIFVMVDTLGAAHKAIGNRFRVYPAHPPLVRSFDRSDKWTMTKEPGQYSPRIGATSTLGKNAAGKLGGNMGGRPNSVFEYVGPAMTDAVAARSLIDGSDALSVVA